MNIQTKSIADMHTRLHTGAAYKFDVASNYTAASGKLPAVIFVHGWESKIFSSKSYNEAAERLRAIGYHTILLSLRGHEESAGDLNEVSRYNHGQDIHAAFEYLAERPEVDIKRLGVVGTSYGAYLLACMAPQLTSVKLMSLRAPALYSDPGWGGPTKRLVDDPGRYEWRSTVRTAADCKAIKGIAEFKGKLLIVWSGEDQDMPPQVLHSYSPVVPFDAKFHIIEGAGHTLDDEQGKEYLDTLERFFKENYPKP